MGSPWVGRCLKSFLEVLRFVVTEYRAVGSQGDLILDKIMARNQNCDKCLSSTWNNMRMQDFRTLFLESGSFCEIECPHEVQLYPEDETDRSVAPRVTQSQ